MIQLVREIYQYYGAKPAQFIREEEIESTAKMLVRRKLENGEKSFRFSSTKDKLPVSGYYATNRFYFNLRKLCIKSGATRRLKLSVDEKATLIARVGGKILDLQSWENEKTYLCKLSGTRGVVATYFCFAYKKQKGDVGKLKSLTTHPIYTDELFNTRNHNTLIFSVENKLQIAGMLLEALSNFSKIGIVHCDISLENVVAKFIEGKKAEGVIIDFELSRSIGTYLSYKSGKIDYCSPERCKNSSAAPGWDVWSLGLVLFLLFQDRTPIWMSDQYDSSQKLSKICSLSSGWAKLPEGSEPRMAYIIPRMLEPDPAKRITPEVALKVFTSGVPVALPEEKKD